MGRSRGGLTTKIHALVDALGRPIELKLTEGQAHDGQCAGDMLETLTGGCTLLADRAYDSDWMRELLDAQNATANIRPLDRRIERPPFDAKLYKERNRVERFFSKLKHFRAIATRFDRLDVNFLASVQLASLRIWMRGYESMT
jgi:transposase